MRLLLPVIVSVVTPLLLPAGADVRGRWKGSVEVKMPDGETVNYPFHMELSQNGEEVTGTAGREEEEKIAIEKGRLEGNVLTFEVIPPESGYPVRFELTWNGTKLEGTFQGETGSGPVSGKAALSRAE